jgi:hypothetical protein
MRDQHLLDVTSFGQSVFKMLDQVMAQVEYHCFVDLRFNRIDPLYKDLCLIISEVLVLKYDSVIKINGASIPIFLVQEVFSQLRNHHLRQVFDNFHNVSHRVNNKKAYLRTALYNSFFEYEAQTVNDMVQGAAVE